MWQTEGRTDRKYKNSMSPPEKGDTWLVLKEIHKITFSFMLQKSFILYIWISIWKPHNLFFLLHIVYLYLSYPTIDCYENQNHPSPGNRSICDQVDGKPDSSLQSTPLQPKLCYRGEGDNKFWICNQHLAKNSRTTTWFFFIVPRNRSINSYVLFPSLILCYIIEKLWPN